MNSLCSNFLILLLILLTSCVEQADKSTKADAPSTHQPLSMAMESEQLPPPLDTSTQYKYAWQEEFQYQQALINRIPVPEDFNRIPLEKETFGSWLRHLPLKPANTAVYYFNGQKKNRQDVHYAVVDMDVGKQDLQQCADAVMRLKAEFHYGRAEYDNIHFNFTSGDRVAFEDWRWGKRPLVRGNSVSFTSKKSTADNSYANFRRYLRQIFNYAGTASLSKELRTIDVQHMQPGDVFILGGFPGHAVLVLDIIEHPQTGERRFLLGQSYMPAQDFHILHNFEEPSISPWYSTTFGETLRTPEWTFNREHLKRFD